MNHRKVWLAKPSVDRLADLRFHTRRVVLARYPTARSAAADQRLEKIRDKMIRRAEAHVVTALIRRILLDAPNAAAARDLYKRSLVELPRNHRSPGSEVEFQTGLTEWRDLWYRFSHLRLTRGGDGEKPAYSVLGFALYKLKDGELEALVAVGCSEVGELKEVVQCTPAAA